MSYPLPCFPVPYFKVDDQYRIMECSKSAKLLFPCTERLTEIVAPGSTAKLARFVKPPQQASIELSLLEASNRPVLYELYQQWEDNMTGHLVLIRSQHRLGLIHRRIERRKIGLWSPEPDVPSVVIKRMAAMQGPALPADASESFREIKNAISTIEDLIGVLQTDLIEAGKDAYAGLILDQTAAIKEWIASMEKEARG